MGENNKSTVAGGCLKHWNKYWTIQALVPVGGRVPASSDLLCCSCGVNLKCSSWRVRKMFRDKINVHVMICPTCEVREMFMWVCLSWGVKTVPPSGGWDMCTICGVICVKNIFRVDTCPGCGVRSVQPLGGRHTCPARGVSSLPPPGGWFTSSFHSGSSYWLAPRPRCLICGARSLLLPMEPSYIDLHFSLTYIY